MGSKGVVAQLMDQGVHQLPARPQVPQIVSPQTHEDARAAVFVVTQRARPLRMHNISPARKTDEKKVPAGRLDSLPLCRAECMGRRWAHNCVSQQLREPTHTHSHLLFF